MVITYLRRDVSVDASIAKASSREGSKPKGRCDAPPAGRGHPFGRKPCWGEELPNPIIKKWKKDSQAYRDSVIKREEKRVFASMKGTEVPSENKKVKEIA